MGFSVTAQPWLAVSSPDFILVLDTKAANTHVRGKVGETQAAQQWLPLSPPGEAKDSKEHNYLMPDVLNHDLHEPRHDR